MSVWQETSSVNFHKRSKIISSSKQRQKSQELQSLSLHPYHLTWLSNKLTICLHSSPVKWDPLFSCDYIIEKAGNKTATGITQRGPKLTLEVVLELTQGEKREVSAKIRTRAAFKKFLKPFLLSKLLYFFVYIAPDGLQGFHLGIPEIKVRLREGKRLSQESKATYSQLPIPFQGLARASLPPLLVYLVEQVIPQEQMTLHLLGKTTKDV